MESKEGREFIDTDIRKSTTGSRCIMSEIETKIEKTNAEADRLSSIALKHFFAQNDPFHEFLNTKIKLYQTQRK